MPRVGQPTALKVIAENAELGVSPEQFDDPRVQSKLLEMLHPLDVFEIVQFLER